MDTPINELPQLQQEILILLRRQKCSTERVIVTLKAEGLDYSELLPHLEALVGMDFVTYEASTEEGFWMLTDKGKVAAELLWFDKKFGDTAALFGALGG